MNKRRSTPGSGHGNRRPLPARRLLAALLLVASGAGRSQDAGGGNINDSARASVMCSSVVLQRCALPTQEPAQRGARAGPRQTAQQKLEARRLAQLQAQAGLDTVEVIAERAPKLEPEQWENFRQSVSGAAVPSCYSPDAAPHQQFAATGLLALPFLVHGHIVGSCR